MEKNDKVNNDKVSISTNKHLVRLDYIENCMDTNNSVSLSIKVHVLVIMCICE